jgi:molybdopterin-guanine dinucleotide biosynthesis protein A
VLPVWSAVILAGGQSRRMGRDKALVELAGKPLLRLAVEKVQALGPAQVFISGLQGTDYSALRCPVLHDRVPGLGPLGCIEQGLRAASLPLVLVLAVDLPLITDAFLRKLTARCDPFSGGVPELDGQLESLAAVYSRGCYALAAALIAGGHYPARGFAVACLEAGVVKRLAVTADDAACFANWNHPDGPCGRREHRTVEALPH